MVSLKAMRVDRKMTQTELAHEVGISLNALIDIEKGRMEPSVDTGMRLCDALGCSPDEIRWEVLK